MIIAIELQTSDVDGEGNGKLVYTDKIATFEHENTAMKFTEDKLHILLIDLDSGRVIENAYLEVI